MNPKFVRMRFKPTWLCCFVVSMCPIAAPGADPEIPEEAAHEPSIWESAQADMSHFFKGKIGGNLPVQMVIAIPGENLIDPSIGNFSEAGDAPAPISGYYSYDRHGRPITLQGAQVEGSEEDYHHLSLTESGDGGKVTGRIELKWRDRVGAKVSGEWTSPDKSKRLPVELELVAVPRQLKAGSARCEFEFSAPYFIRKSKIDTAANQKIQAWRSEQFAAHQEADTEQWEEAIGPDAEWIGIPHEHSTSIAPVHCADDMISLVAYESAYTGGAHGNYWFGKYNAALDRSGELREIALADLFSNPEQGIKIVAGKVIERLRAREAIWGIVEKTPEQVKPEELGTFTLTPQGIAFAFAPYEVHAFAAGCFYTTIAWDEIAGIVDTGRWPFLKRWLSAGTGKSAQPKPPK